MSHQEVKLFDALYGPISFSQELSALMRAPVVQRMRHIRLSNIDSLALPGIAGLNRFEHVVGTAYLSTVVGCAVSASPKQRIALQAAALLHDWAITAFGHLVEEAFAYVNSTFNHEGKLYELLVNAAGSDVGGVNRQVLCGREPGILDWCTDVFGGEADRYLKLITQTIAGAGAWGPVVAGQIDLDNIDNLHRIAFHMGMRIDKEAPVRLSRALLGATEQGVPIFARAARQDLMSWVELRRGVYNHLMLAQPDFTAKLMLLYATFHAMRAEEFTDRDWNMTDVEFVSRLLKSKVKEAKDAADRWATGEFWEMAPLLWLSAPVPAYSMLSNFSDELSKEIGRPVFAYRIKDKRERKLSIQFEDGLTETFGESSRAWLLGVGSPAKRPFSKSEQSGIRSFAARFFCTDEIVDAGDESESMSRQGSLI